MKKVRKQVYCSRCGDLIPPDELALLQGPICALCDHMQVEAQQIWRDKRKKSKKLGHSITYPAAVNPR